ncbi:MAG: hypothetical protein KDC27_10390 [Acidobacteria bacterium]|nr:hypothetical protein [Acidobacteriota bacterium]
MSDFYQQIEDGLVRHLQMLSDLADVQTFSAEALPLVFSTEQLAKRFAVTELPAVRLSTQTLPTRSEPSAAGMIVYRIPLDVDVVVAHQERETARRRALEIQMALVPELHRLGRGLDAETVWGANVFVGDEIESTLVLVEGKTHQFAIATIEATVERYVGLDD